jgi:hypothetical protein
MPDSSLNSSDSSTLYPSNSSDPVTADDSKNSSSNASCDDIPNATVPAPYTAPAAATAVRRNARVGYDSTGAGGSAKTSACETNTGGSKMAVMGTVHVPSRFVLGSCMPGLAWLILYQADEMPNPHSRTLLFPSFPSLALTELQHESPYRPRRSSGDSNRPAQPIPKHAALSRGLSRYPKLCGGNRPNTDERCKGFSTFRVLICVVGKSSRD